MINVGPKYICLLFQKSAVDSIIFAMKISIQYHIDNSER
jgi:hypothetical protein